MILTNLRSQARYFATGDSTSTDFSDTDSLRQLNSAYQQLVVLAMANSGDWQFRGDNSQTTSITSATRSYSLPTTYLRISRVDIKYPSTASDYVKATQIDYTKITSNGVADYTPSKPEFDLKGDVLEIFVSDKTTDISAVTSGIIIYYEDELTELASASDEPDIPEPFARLMCLMAARDYCGVNTLSSRLSWLTNEITKEEARFTEFIAGRSSAKRVSIKFCKEDYGSGKGDIGEPSWDWN